MHFFILPHNFSSIFEPFSRRERKSFTVSCSTINSCDRRGRSHGVIWWRLQWRREGEEKKSRCSVAIPSGIRHQIEIQNTIPYDPAPFSCIGYQDMSESSLCYQSKKKFFRQKGEEKREKSQKEENFAGEAGEAPSPAAEKIKNYGAFSWRNCCLTDLYRVSA